ncbi:MAG: amidohydrolase family protein [Campylobacterota bacterium]|nr:amidohydrolase family protein [Campylobacterota bacterium]
MKALQHIFLALLLTTLMGNAKTVEKTVLVVNADIVTMDPNNPSAEAMAFKGNRIIALGSEKDVREKIGEYQKYYNLKGQTIVPGFFESHDHMYLSSMTYAITDVSPYTTPTLAEALEKIQHTQPDKEGWIVAFGADKELYKEKEGPTRDKLDKLFPHTPVIVLHLSGHGGFANSAALKRANVDENTPDPKGGYYEKDDKGRLTGYLSGQPALFSVKNYPNPTPQTALLAAQDRAKKGVTTASEFALMNIFVLEGLQSATSDPNFPVRVVGGLFSTIEDFEEVAPRVKHYETDLFKIPFIKTWTDGSIQGGTGHLTQGYHEKSFGGGGAQGTQEHFNKQVLRMYELGFWPAIHANGDGAVDVALNAVEYAQKSLPKEKTEDIRPQVIHANYTRPEQIKRMKALNVLPTFFPTHIYYYGELHYQKTLGPVRAQRLNALGDAFREGLKASMHNDPPVTPVDPLLNMWIAVNRTTAEGRVVGKEQAITPYQALQAYTINAAYQFGMEKDAGSLEVGKFSDFVVLDKNPLKVDKNEIRNIRIAATVRGGLITYADTPEYDRDAPPCSCTSHHKH